MSIQQDLLPKITQLSDGDFRYSKTSDFDYVNTLDTDCSAIVLEATVCYLEMKNTEMLLKTGKRLAARIYKIYYHTLQEVAKQSGAFLSCYAPNSFLLIYLKDQYGVSHVVDTALKTTHLISDTLKELIEKHGHINFSMGIDVGTILGTLAVDGNNHQHLVWFGKTIEKAKTICHECLRPFYVGISGTVFHHLDDDLKTTTKRILGFKKQVEIWNRASYQFENTKKHLYQTNFHKPFEDN